MVPLITQVLVVVAMSSFLYVWRYGKVSYCNHTSSGGNRWKCTGRCTSASSSHSSSGNFKLIHETSVY